MPGDQVVLVTGRLILISGLGSILGPMIGTSVMARLSSDGVFYSMAIAGLVLAALSTGRRLVTASPTHRERTFEILAPQATPLAHDMLGPSMRASDGQIQGETQGLPGE
jgi:hypothetical protein